MPTGSFAFAPVSFQRIGGSDLIIESAVRQPRMTFAGDDLYSNIESLVPLKNVPSKSIALYQNWFAELSSNDDELASVHHWVRRDKGKHVTHCRAEFAEVVWCRLVEIGFGI